MLGLEGLEVSGRSWGPHPPPASRREHPLAEHQLLHRPDCLGCPGPGSACATRWPRYSPAHAHHVATFREEGLRDDFKDAKEGSVLPGPQPTTAG